MLQLLSSTETHPSRRSSLTATSTQRSIVTHFKFQMLFSLSGFQKSSSDKRCRAQPLSQLRPRRAAARFEYRRPELCSELQSPPPGSHPEHRVASREYRSEGPFQKILVLKSCQRPNHPAWGVFDDAAEEGRIVETFLVGSWIEHLRQHERVTNADRVLQDTVDRFHLGGTPKVTHFVAADL
jgi:hypothetical protein